MSLQTASGKNSPPSDVYNTLERAWPIQIETDSEGKLLKVLLKESWYEPLKRLYDYWEELYACSESISIDGLTLPEFPEFSIEIGVLGIKIFVIRAVIWAAKKGIGLSKFELRDGGWGAPRIGWSPMSAVMYEEV
jgi:hypothetical protein